MKTLAQPATARQPATSHNPWLVHRALIEAIRPEVADVATYYLRLADTRLADNYRFLPGQFNMLYVPGCGEVAISMSGPISSTGHELLHTIRLAGRVTDAIIKLREGDSLGLRGPFGTAWPVAECVGRDVIVVAGGLGMAPLRPLLYELMGRRGEFGKVVLLVGARSPDLMLFEEEFARWRALDIQIELTVDRAINGWAGSIGVVPLLLDRLEPLNASQSVVMICGPEVMMHYAALAALRRGIAKESIWISMERNMQCAVGQCGHCQLGPHFVCKQGPVFRFEAMEPYLKYRDF